MSGQKLMIVDDEPEVLELLGKRLTDSGYDIITASLGEEAVRKAIKETPDLILLDIVLPDFDGSEVVQQIRNRMQTERKIPVIFLSGIVSADGKEELPEVTVGGLDYPALPKPISYNRLLMEIEKMLP